MLEIGEDLFVGYVSAAIDMYNYEVEWQHRSLVSLDRCMANPRSILSHYSNPNRRLSPGSIKADQNLPRHPNHCFAHKCRISIANCLQG